jgi:hypothetical protein
MTEEQVQYVARCVRDIVGRSRITKTCGVWTSGRATVTSKRYL